MMYKYCRDTATQSKQSMFFFSCAQLYERLQKVKNIKLFRAEQKCEKDKG